MGALTRPIKHKGIMITYNEAASILDVSYAIVVAMFKKGIVTIDGMIKYRKDIKENMVRKGGRVASIHQTSVGKMTVIKMAEIHKYKLAVMTIRSRADVWGWDHKCLWLDKSTNNKQFRKDAILLDGPPRGEYSGLPVKKVKPKSTKMNRLKCCFRDNGTQRCAVYSDWLKLNTGRPEKCLSAVGDTCKNYTGIEIKPGIGDRNTGVRLYKSNGTYSQYEG